MSRKACILETIVNMYIHLAVSTKTFVKHVPVLYICLIKYGHVWLCINIILRYLLFYYNSKAMIFKCDYFLVLWLCLHANWYNLYYDIHYLNNVNKSMLTQCCIIQKINVWANVWFCYNRLQVRSWRSMKKSTLPWRSKRCNKRTRLRGWRWVQTNVIQWVFDVWQSLLCMLGF